MMKIVTLITAFFLPITTVATIYGTEFFRTEDAEEGRKKVVVDPSAWNILWFSMPLVFALCAIWYGAKRTSEARNLREGKPQAIFLEKAE